MGYQTNYTLTLQPVYGRQVVELKSDAPLLETIKELRAKNSEAQCSLTEDGGCSGNDSRWYEHENELKEFSAANPGVLFTLHGEGEDPSDQWKKYFLNGKVQVARARISIAPVDLEKLV